MTKTTYKEKHLVCLQFQKIWVYDHHHLLGSLALKLQLGAYILIYKHKAEHKLEVVWAFEISKHAQ